MDEKRYTFAQIYEDEFSYVYNYLYMRILHKETAEDLCSQTFLKAYTLFEHYDSQKASPRTWLCMIARSALIDHYRAFASHGTAPLEEMPETPVMDDYAVFQDSANQEVLRLLQHLKADERELLSLRYGMDMSVKEIAGHLQISEKACSKRFVRIFQKCRKLEEGHQLSDFL